MKRLVAPFLLLLAALPLSAATTSRYMVATRHGARAAALRAVGERDFDVREFRVIDAFAADLTEEEAAALRRSPNVRYVSRVVERHLAEVGTAKQTDASPYQHAQTIPYGIDMIHAREVWPHTRGNSTVNVATLDTGIDYHHVDLAARYAGGYDTFKQTNDPFDENEHGTHVAGIIGATDNGVGVVGVAPEVKIWSVKVLDKKGQGTDETIVAGVDWLIAKKHDVGGNWILSLSLASREPSDIEQEAFERAAAEGMFVVAAAGNDGAVSLSFPAAYSTVLAVGAVDANVVRPSFSNTGSNLGVMAPGVDVLSTVPMGTALTASVITDAGKTYTAYQLTGSPMVDVTGEIVACGLGHPEDFPMNVAGRIAVIERGEITFAEKVRNAKAAGAIAVIVMNADASASWGWTLIRRDCTPSACVPYAPDVTFDWPLTISITHDDGLALLNSRIGKVTAGAWKDDYTLLSGTSMATPHVTGTVALLWSLAPSATIRQLRDAITMTAHDLGNPGFDSVFGFGLIDALAAAKQIAPAAFGLPAPPPGAPRRRDAPH